MFTVRWMLRLKVNKYSPNVIQVQQQYFRRRFLFNNPRFVTKKNSYCQRKTIEEVYTGLPYLDINLQSGGI